MSNDEVKQLIASHFQGATVDVKGDGYHFEALIISEAFEGQSRVKRQQAVYRVLAESIANGSLHALTMKTFTPTEWESQTNG